LRTARPRVQSLTTGFRVVHFGRESDGCFGERL
jgi:hypothetical protein